MGSTCFGQSKVKEGSKNPLSDKNLTKTNEKSPDKSGEIEEQQSLSDSSDSEYIDQVDLGDHLYRVSQAETHESLHRHIGVLIFKANCFPGRSIKGTGLLISPNLVLTCSHNLFEKESRQQNFDFRFYPGHCGILDTTRGYTVQSIFFPPLYKEYPKSAKYQYALLKLKGKIKDSAFLPLRAISSKDTFQELAVFGYPGKYYEVKDKAGEKLEVYQWGLEKKEGIIEINEKKGRLVHCLSTFSGQSGAPIIAVDDQNLSVVGIHKGGTQKLDGKDIRANVGRLMTTNVIKELKNKAMEWKAEMFTIYEQQIPKIFKLPMQRDSTLGWMKILKYCSTTDDNGPQYTVPGKQMKMNPHKLIGMVTVNKYVKGAGILLSPNLVLTSAVNVFDTWSTKMHTGLCFSPGFSSDTPKEQYSIEDSYVSKHFFEQESLEHNYCLLKLSKRVEDKEFVPIHENVKFYEVNQQIAVFGYNSVQYEKQEVKQIGRLGKHCAVEIKNNNKEFLYKLQTSNGMGGGPILSLDQNAKLSIVGIHIGSVETTSGTFKHGRLLTKELVNQLREQAQKLRADLFQ